MIFFFELIAVLNTKTIKKITPMIYYYNKHSHIKLRQFKFYCFKLDLILKFYRLHKLYVYSYT